MIRVYFIGIITFVLFSCNNEHDHKKTATGEERIVISKTDPDIVDTVKKSTPAFVQNKIGDVHFTIKYHSPAVRGRVIWGGLVPFGEVWVTGAHSATSIESDKDFYIENKLIPASKYSFFTIPTKENWTVILNSNWDQHLADEYSEKDDILRFQIKPDTLDHIQERLMYDIDQSAQKQGNILLQWERLRLVIPVRVP